MKRKPWIYPLNPPDTLGYLDYARAWWLVWLQVSKTSRTTLSRGLEQFESTFFGWKLALGELVCTP